MIKDWPALEEYTVENLVDRYGEMKVDVSDIPYARKFGGLEAAHMSLGEYVSKVRQHRIDGGTHPWYVFKGHKIPDASEGKDSLVPLELLPTPPGIVTAFERIGREHFVKKDNEEEEKRSHSFINAQFAVGGEGTGAPVHYHYTAWSALVYGAKKWVIYPPAHQIMSNKQILDYFETDKMTFENRGIRAHTCVQTAGDVMIIPENWGHGVLNLQVHIHTYIHTYIAYIHTYIHT
jgi:hypothetical protein